MMEGKFRVITDSIEVRSLQENNKPRYIVNGTALISDKKHIYQYTKSKDGNVRTLKNIFTPHCIQSIKEQSKHKSLFVDIQHELVRDASINAILKEKLSKEEYERVDSMMKKKMLPMAKLNDIDIEGDSLKVYTEMNPIFPEVDDFHKKLFDATWFSLENKYLDGISINFGEFKYLNDSEGNLVIDDAEVLGFSYVNGAHGEGHTIDEVAIRALQEGDNLNELKKMEDEKKILENEKAKLAEERKAVEAEKLEIQKAKDEAKLAEENKKKAELEKQMEEQKRIQKEIEEKTLALKKQEDELNKAKGVVGQKPNPNAVSSGKTDSEFYKENLNKITAEHDATIQTLKSGKKPLIDKTMKGFSELVNLQAKAGNLTADLDGRNADYVEEYKLLDRAGSDIITPKPTIA